MMSPSWSRTSRYFVLALVLAFLLWFLVAANNLIGPLVISALLAYVLNPLVALANERARLPRKWVVLLVYLVSLAILITLSVIFAPIIPDQVASLVNQLQRIILEIERQIARPLIVMGFVIPMDEVMADFLADPAIISTDFISPDVILGIVQAASTNLAWILVILVTTYYLLQDWPRLREWLIVRAPDPIREDIRRLYQEVSNVWQRYLVGQLRLMFIVGLATGLVSAAVGLPAAWAFGILAGLLDIILTVGPAIVMIIAALIALFVGSNFLPLSNIWFMVLVVGLYAAVQMAEHIWLRPRVMGHTLRMHPAIVFIAIVGSLALAGILVALIIIPVIGSISIIGRYLYYKILDMHPWPDEEPIIPPVAAAETEGVKAGTGETAVSSQDV